VREGSGQRLSTWVSDGNGCGEQGALSGLDVPSVRWLQWYLCMQMASSRGGHAQAYGVNVAPPTLFLISVAAFTRRTR
jgi:hypothetical protein